MKNIQVYENFMENDKKRGIVPEGYEKKDIKALIQELERLQSKGVRQIEYKGTVMCSQDGNYIVMSTEKQM